MCDYQRLSFVLVVAFASSVWCNVIGKRSTEDNEVITFKEHMDRVQKFRCSTPQMRSFLSRELVQGLTTTEIVSPDMTVLHWCDAGAGCCLGSETSACAKKEWQMVDLPFIVRNHFEGTERELIVKVQNHTSCACQNSYNGSSDANPILV